MLHHPCLLNPLCHIGSPVKVNALFLAPFLNISESDLLHHLAKVDLSICVIVEQPLWPEGRYCLSVPV